MDAPRRRLRVLAAALGSTGAAAEELALEVSESGEISDSALETVVAMTERAAEQKDYLRAAQLQLAIPQTDGAPRKRGRPPKASTLAARQTPKAVPQSPKSARRKATISAAAAAQMLPPTTTRSRAASDADLGSPSQRHRGTPRSAPEDPSPEAAAARKSGII